MEPRNWFQGMNSASLCSLAGRYDYTIPTRFLAPIDCLKIPAQRSWSVDISYKDDVTVIPFLRELSTMYDRLPLPSTRKWAINMKVMHSNAVMRHPNLCPNVGIKLFLYFSHQTKPSLVNDGIKLCIYYRQSKPYKCRYKTLPIFPPNQTLEMSV